MISLEIMVCRVSGAHVSLLLNRIDELVLHLQPVMTFDPGNQNINARKT